MRLDNTLKDELFSVDGYDLLRKDRNRQGGGVAIYIKSTINYHIRQDLDLENIEGICVEIRRPCSKPFVMLACYRPPNYDPSFFVKIEEIISRIDLEDKELILVGDLNCNFLSRNQDSNYNMLKSITETYQLSQLIKAPTRVSNSSASLIDVIFTNCPNKITCSGVLHTSFSDHYPVYAVRKISATAGKSHKFISYRDYSKFDALQFRNDLTKLPWKV